MSANDQDLLAARISFLADHAVLIELGTISAGVEDPLDRLTSHPWELAAASLDAPDGFVPLPIGVAASSRAIGLADALQADQRIHCRDIVPAYRTVLLDIGPDTVEREHVIGVIRDLVASLTDRPDVPARLIHLPVTYGGEFGPDLDDVAAYHGVPAETIISRHAGGGPEPYVVAFVGFAPGFGYLLGLPDDLATPRLSSPRTRVPVGAVAIGGAQTGVYSLPTPGGWRIIGRTPARLFDPDRAEPTLLRPGDRLRFSPIDASTYADLAEKGASGATVHAVTGWPDGHVVHDRSSKAPPAIDEPPDNIGHLHVVRPGLLTTVQDLGRPGFGRSGVTESGALDRRALMLGNRLVGNNDDAAGLEITLLGPELVANAPLLIAITGADLGPMLDGRPLPMHRAVTVASGCQIAFDPTRQAVSGARAYLCIAGGVAVSPVLGSRSTDLTGGLGGLDGRAIRAGDALPIGKPTGLRTSSATTSLATTRLDVNKPLTVRVCLNLQAAQLGQASLRRFLDTTWTVSPRSDRMGMRLTGPVLELPHGADLVSEGIAHGAIQVPGDGQPIVLLAGRQTVGGYIKPATVISADLDELGQLRPGDTLRFHAVSDEDAHVAGAVYRQSVATPTVTGDAQAITGVHSTMARGDQGAIMSDTADEWTPLGVAHVIASARMHGATRLRLDVATLGVHLEVDFSDSSDTPRTNPDHDDVDHVDVTPTHATEPESVVQAPVVGLVYLRPSPEEPPFVELGQLVETGTVVALIEVMKTFHEMTAPLRGTVAEILVEDGTAVEYSQPIMRLASVESA